MKSCAWGAGLAAVFVSAAAYADGAVPFGPRQVVDTTGQDPRTVVAVDLDGDGDLDLVSTSLADNSVQWFENSGGGSPTFTKRVITSTAGGAREIWAADIDRDGDQDIALASRADDTIRWFENLGGSPLAFAEHIIFDQLNNAWSVYVVDVDRDGDMDVLSAGSLDENTINWHENEGGSPIVWTRRIIDADAKKAQRVYADDVDGDGDMDLLSASSASGAQEIAWYESDGAAEPIFVKHVLTNTLTNAKWVTTGDLDGDGDRDIVGVGEFLGEIRWWDNDGAQPPVFTQRIIGTVAGAKTATVIDLDFDGDADVVAHGIGNDEIVFFENTGGTPPAFTSHVVSTESDNPLTVFPADLDGDGDPDLAAASFADDTVGWYENTSPSVSLAIEDAPVVVSTGASPVAVTPADLDRDGRLDLVVATRDDTTVAWYRNQGGTPVSFAAGAVVVDQVRGPRDVVVGDIDHDGDPDVITAFLNDDTVIMAQNNGDSPPTFTPIAIGGVIPDARAVALADVDRDGDTDVIVCSQSTGDVYLLESDGLTTPGFTPRVIATGVAGAVKVTVGDLNRDGAPDVVVAARDDDEVVLLLNDGQSPVGFTPPVAVAAVDGPKDVLVIDFDHDGDLDLISGSSVTGEVVLLENTDPAGPLWSLTSLASGPAGLKSLAATDADHDGDTDILAAGSASGDVIWLENTGGGVLQPSVALMGFTQPSDVILADISGDSFPDVIALDQDTNTLGVQVWTPLSLGAGARVTAVSSAPAKLEEGKAYAVFSVEIEHFAASGEPVIEAVDAGLSIEDEFGQPLPTSVANKLFQSLQVFLDDGDGIFDPIMDPTLYTDFSPSFQIDGSFLLPLSGDGGVAQIPSMETRILFVVGVLALDAVENEPPLFRLELDPSSVNLSAASMNPVGVSAGPGVQTPLLTPIPSLENRLIGQPWRAHTIDDTFLGAESVHAVDMNGDGFIDMVAAWEQQNVATFYINPGPALVTGPWVRTQTGETAGPETSIPVDLDGDGRLDIVSSLEVGVIMVHWSPPPGQDILDPKNWVEMEITAQPAERWGPLEAINIDNQNGPDLVFGALGVAGDFDVPIGWLRCPANPRDPLAWTYSPLGDAAFVTTVIAKDMDGDGDEDVTWTDRLFDAADRAAWWFENPGPGPALMKPWAKHLIGSQEHMPMIMDLGDIDGDGLEDAAVPDRDYFPEWHRRLDGTGLNWSSHGVFWPSDMGSPKSFRIGDIDLDGKPDLAATAIRAVQSASLVGVAWLKQPADPLSPSWTPYNVGGGAGEKFDRIMLEDLDNDGDLDIVTTEERNNSLEIAGLGVVWYENPTLELDGDVSRNGRTDGEDLALMLSQWQATGDQLAADLDNDGTVGGSDLAILLSAWGHVDLDADP